MPINILLLLLVGIAVLTSLGAYALFLQRRFNPKLQFSLRSFLVLVATLAIILACTIGYRQSYMAQVTWIPVAKVQKTNDGRFEFVYYARNRSIQRLMANNNIGNYVVTEEAVRVTTRDELFVDSRDSRATVDCGELLGQLLRRSIHVFLLLSLDRL